MLSLSLFLVFTVSSGWRLMDILARFESVPLTPLERRVWTAVTTLALWLAQGHALSLAGLFSPTPLVWSSFLICASLLAGTSATSRGLSWPRLPRRDIRGTIARIVRQPIGAETLLPFALAAMCVAYSAAALAVLPVSNHDALSYHFPKAAWLATTGAFGLYPSQDLRVTYFPGNYEMLAATFLTFLRSDRATGLITSGSLLLFLATSLVLFRRAWGRTPSAALTVPMLLASPVLFLHITAHKNDIMMAAVTLSALTWLGRYALQGGLGSASVGLLSLGIAIGTKFHGLFAALAATILIWRAWRNGIWRPTAAQAILQGSAVTATFLLLGGVQYIANVVSTGHLTGILQVATPNAMNTVAYPAYWQVPRFIWMLLAAPLFTRGQYFTVPWSGETWFWPAYELYFSHYGIHVSLLILLLPLGVWWTRRQIDSTARRELAGISIAALALVGLNMLMGLRPYGGFAFIPRFLFFALPVLLVWTWCPLIDVLGRVRRWTWIPLAASLAIPMVYIATTVTKDSFSSLQYVELAWREPQWRRDVFRSNWRAATIVDRLALPDAVVAIDSGYDGWTYPLYGARLTRTVQVIVDGAVPYVPDPEVEWVAVDRAFSKVWGHPLFTDMSQARLYIDRGEVPDGDMVVYNSLLANTDFELVYFSPTQFQAVFKRIRPIEAQTVARSASGMPW